ncbi:glycosyltransferase [bacterium]|nr:glycosyltransferase [bacterium]
MNSDNIEITVVAPAMNEELNIKLFFESCLQAEKTIGKNIEIVFIDDGSTDQTLYEMQSLKFDHGEKIQIIKHLTNLGITRSLKDGFDRSLGQFVVWLPTDLECNPSEDLPKLYDKYLEGYHVISGSRLNRGDGKLLASEVYNFVSRKLFGIQSTDLNWIKGFDKVCLKDLTLRGDWHRFMLHELHTKGYNLGEVPVNWYKRKHGISKFGRKRFLTSITDVLGVWFILSFRDRPMRFFGSIFLFTILIGVALQSALVVLYLQQNTQIRPLLSLSFYIQGFGIASLYTGFIAELIANNGHK